MPKKKILEKNNEEVKQDPVIEVVKMKEKSKAELMRESLMKQPTRRIIIPKDKGEPEGITESVILNGARFNIKKGVYVDVPEQIADIIEESTLATAKAYDDAKEKLKNSIKMEFDNSN